MVIFKDAAVLALYTQPGVGPAKSLVHVGLQVIHYLQKIHHDSISLPS